MLLDASQKDKLSEVVDIELSTQEDNVQTLAISKTTDQWATVYAGINSSQAEQQRGVNEHLRSFLLEYPPKRRNDSQGSDEALGAVNQNQTKALGRAALFTPSAASEKLTYQRVLRLSKKQEGNGPRLGVVATGLAPEGEIVIFAADTSRPSFDDVRKRLNLGEKVEAADVDIIGLEADEKRGEGNFRVAYCTDYDVYCTDVNYTYNHPAGNEPSNIYGNTGHEYQGASDLPPPKFRCLRFLTPTLLLVIQNIPKQAGSEVMVMELTGAILAHIPLHRKIKSATGVSVTSLPYPDNFNLIQHAVAIAGADRSITIFTIDHPASSPYGRKLTFKKYAFLPNVHENSIMSLTFSEHNAPNVPYASAPTQYLKLASTSMVNTCVVHTMVLAPFPAPTSEKDRPAYLLASPAKQSMTQNTFSVVVAIIAIVIGSFFLQAFTEIRGGAPEYLGVKEWLSPAVHDWIARPYMFEDGIKSAWSRSISSEVETASSIISKVIETPSSVISEAGSTASSVASSVVSSGSSAASKAASPAVEQASKAASKASSAASSVVSSASSKASEGASMVSSSASEEVSGASSVLSEAASSASSSLSEGASSISSNVSKGASKASSVGSSIVSSGSSIASDAGSSISSSASQGASSASKAASEAVSTVSSHVDDAASAAASTAEAMASSASEAASSASSIAATDAGAEPLASSASEIASSASSLASSAASQASASASSAAASATSSIPTSESTSSFSDKASTAYDAVSSSASSAATAASSGASSAVAHASIAAADLAHGAQEKLGLRALLAARDTGAIRQQNEAGSDGHDGDDNRRGVSNVPHEIVVRHTDDDSTDGSEGEGAKTGLSVETHPPERVVEREMNVKRWEDLGGKEKEGWMKRYVISSLLFFSSSHIISPSLHSSSSILS